MAGKKKNWFKDTDAFELGAIIFIIVGIFLVLVAIGLGLNAKINLEGGGEWYNITTYSEFVATLIGGVWSLAGVLLFYSSLSSQKADLEAQKDLLVKQIDEVVAQTKEFRIQNEMAKDQKNEETFFQLLRFHNEIIASIELEQSEMDFTTGENINKIILGRKAFVEYYDIFKRFFGETSENIQVDSDESLSKLFDNCYNAFYLEYQADLGHYFRNLYNLLMFVKGVKKELQSFYLSLLIAQLSNYELTMLFFHCLRKTNVDLKKLVEEFEVLAQVPKDEVTSMAYKLYDSKAFGEDGFGSGDVLEDHINNDIDSDSLLGQISQSSEAIERSDGKESSTGLGFMEDLLNRIKGVGETVKQEPDKSIELNEEINKETEEFLSGFFDRTEEKEKEDEDKLMVFKEKQKAKEKAKAPDLNDFFGDIDTSEEDNKSKEVTEEIVTNDFLIESSDDYNDDSEIENIKSQFLESEESEFNYNLDETDSLDLDGLKGLIKDDEQVEISHIDEIPPLSDFIEQDTFDSDNQNKDDEQSSSLNMQKDEESSNDFLIADIDLNDELAMDSVNKNILEKESIDETKSIKDNRKEVKSDRNNETKKKPKKLVKVKSGKSQNKPKGSSGFLTKL